MAGSRRQYPFHLIEPKWQQTWEQQQAFRAFNPGDSVPEGHPFGKRHGLSGKVAVTQLPQKFYILDMFPYPSGAGLHVGHPEGYTATDILARYRRACGFNVLHPMGWDSFGLPAEQYAVKTGQHPRVTTEANIANFTRQIKSLGFSYDWARELATTDPDYFKWTQWIFLKLYNSWFNPETNKAEPIETLMRRLDYSPSREKYSGQFANIVNPLELEAEKIARRLIDSQRLAYVSEAPVNWCPELGTVLANEEVIDGKSEVGGFPVIRKPMRQWMLRITAYAEKLLADLDTIDWSDSLKEMQRNWIGRSEGAEVDFILAGPEYPGVRADSWWEIQKWREQRSKEGFARQPENFVIRVFTTRPDTLFGATYMVLSPEHKLVPQLTTPEQKEAVEDYKAFAAGKSDLERTELAKEKTGVFTGAYAINPVNGEKIPIWIADYVLASYGTGAIMAVPAHDERDWEFVKTQKRKLEAIAPKDVNGEPDAVWVCKRELNIKPVVLSKDKTGDLPYCDEGIAIASPPNHFAHGKPDFIPPDINGLPTAEAKAKIAAWLEEKGLGKKTINYKLRDWLFSRQRYWGEPFPIIWKKDVTGNLYHEALPESSLPLLPPSLEDYKPTPDGQPPLARAKDWLNLPDGSVRETNTMPQWAGSCWYYLRYLNAKNSNAFVGKDAESYWMGTNSSLASKVSELESDSRLRTQDSRLKSTTPGVDLYVGGTEHAVLHLLYARFWHKVLFDLGYVSTPEPFFKLVNQGLILGEMEFTAFAYSDGRPCSIGELKDISEEATPSGKRMAGTHKKTGELIVGKRIRDDEVEKTSSGFALKSDKSVLVDARSFKMAKSRGNVVNPDDVIREFGADSLRLYEMFMGPLQDTKPWSTKGVEGVYRFLGRVWRLFVDEKSETAFEQAETTTEAQKRGELLDLILLDGAISDIAATPAQLKALHACIKKVTEDLDGMRFNTAISAMMVFVNEAMTWQSKPLPVMKTFLQLLAPFAPHLAEELWARLHSTFGLRSSSLPYEPWPKFDAALLVESEIEIPVSVNGKMRDVIKVPTDADNVTIEAAAKSSEKVKPFLDGKIIKKVIIVPKKMVNIVVG